LPIASRPRRRAPRLRQGLHRIEDQDFRPRRRSIFVLTALVLLSGLGGVLWLFSG
jgi:hypothetical protein